MKCQNIKGYLGEDCTPYCFLNSQSQQVSMFDNQSIECISFGKQSHMTCDAFK